MSVQKHRCRYAVRTSRKSIRRCYTTDRIVNNCTEIPGNVGYDTSRTYTVFYIVEIYKALCSTGFHFTHSHRKCCR